MTDTTAPICHVPVTTPIEQPGGVQNPFIPIATDLQSALAAINAMRMILMRIANLQPRFDGSGSGGRGRVQQPSKQQKNPKPGRWNEINRVTKKEKVYNPEDREQFVEVERMNRLVMEDSITKEQWIWSR